MARWYEMVYKIQHTYSSDQISFAKRYVSDVAVQARWQSADAMVLEFEVH